MQFAWVRGARIQHKPVHDDEWTTLPRSTVPVYEEWDRIHPDDEHLAYGPLSSKLRTADNPDDRSIVKQAAMRFVFGLLPSNFVALTEEDSELLSFFKLFVAEYLADKGI